MVSLTRSTPIADIAIETRRRIDSRELDEREPSEWDISRGKKPHTTEQKTAIKLMHRYEGATEKLNSMLESVGKRYAEWNLQNVVTENPDQRAVVADIRAYVQSGKIRAGNNLILTGPRGTGKDSLMVAAAKECVRWHAHTVTWRNGLDVINDLVDNYFGRLDWSEYFEEMRRLDVLYISDPLPPSGSLNQAEQSALLKLIDWRYRHCRSTWVTMNADSPEEMDARLGPLIADRLRDGATLIECKWESYRRLAT